MQFFEIWPCALLLRPKLPQKMIRKLERKSAFSWSHITTCAYRKRSCIVTARQMSFSPPPDIQESEWRHAVNRSSDSSAARIDMRQDYFCAPRRGQDSAELWQGFHSALPRVTPEWCIDIPTDFYDVSWLFFMGKIIARKWIFIDWPSRKNCAQPSASWKLLTSQNSYPYSARSKAKNPRPSR